MHNDGAQLSKSTRGIPLAASQGVSADQDVKKLLEQYIHTHNERALRGDEGVQQQLASDDLEIDVEGCSLSTLRREGIVRSFREQQVVLWKIGTVGDDVAFANYAWRSHPRIGGLIRLQRENGRIRRVTLRPGYSRIFGLLDGGSTADAFAS